MNGDEDLGEDIIMKGEPYHYNQKKPENHQLFATFVTRKLFAILGAFRLFRLLGLRVTCHVAKKKFRNNTKYIKPLPW